MKPTIKTINENLAKTAGVFYFKMMRVVVPVNGRVSATTLFFIKEFNPV
jgi:hypothetical protein